MGTLYSLQERQPPDGAARRDLATASVLRFPDAMPPRLVQGALVGGSAEPVLLTALQQTDLAEALHWCMLSCTPGHPSTSHPHHLVEVIAFPDAVTIVGFGRDMTHLEAVELCERLIASARLG